MEESICNAVFEGLAVQKLHGDERLAFMLANFVNGANVGMIKCGCCLCFALETFKRGAVMGHQLGQKLQSYETVEPAVLGLVDDTHASAADFFDDAIVGNGLTDHAGECSWRSS